MTWPIRGVAQGVPDRWSGVYVGTKQPGWTDNASTLLSSSPVASGKKRVLVLALGESGMMGYGAVTDSLPVGYPPIPSTTLQSYDTTRGWIPLVEPTHGPLQAGVTPAVSAAGIFCWQLQALLGSTFEVALIPSAWSGSYSTDWVVGGTRYNVAKANALGALAQANAVLGCILLEQGINDATAATQAGWASRWSAIETQLRIDLAATVAPIYFAQDTVTVCDKCTTPNWSALKAEKTSWASANRFLVQKPDGPWIDDHSHLTTAAQAVLAQAYLDTWIAHPGVLV